MTDVLDGTHVRLEPLSLDHVDSLCAVGLDPALWEWIPRRVKTAEQMRAYVERAIAERDAGRSLPFATVDRVSRTVVGSTRLGAIDLANRRAEIGWTWIARPWQRSAINTEAKLLMLTHAFDAMHCRRVELKTDALNARSRAAIDRIGARFEGVFRRHMSTDTGRVRDTAWYAVTDEEWPAVRDRLAARLG